MQRRFSLFAFFLLLIAATACNTSKPSVVLASPPQGSQFQEGETVAFQSLSSDQDGITRVELLVDGATVRTDAPPTTQGQASFTLIQTWKATPGTHTVLIRAYNIANAMSDPAAISISVLPAATPTITIPPAISAPPVPPLASTATVTPTAAQAPTSPGSGCTNNAAFVSDVTISDGTQLAPGQAFNKIWRVRNSGTCAWAAGYALVYVSGEAMTTSVTVAVPDTAPGATADLQVALTAPTTPGVHTGVWRLRNASNVIFGTSISVSINVTSPNAPAPTAVPTTVGAPPSSGCTGAPAISSFTSDKSSVFAGATVKLSWGAVTNADSVDIDHNIGGIATPGSIDVNPFGTTTYTLTAHCGANSASRAVTINVTTLTINTLPPPAFILFQVTDVSVAITKKTCNAPLINSVDIAGTIKTNGPGDVTYHWEGSGLSTTAATIHFNSATTQDVFTTHFGVGGQWTATLHVTSPNAKNSSTLNYTCP